MKTDFQVYHDLQQAMRDMIRAGMFNTLAFEDAWRMSEAIKNRHGGMPPLPEDYEANELEQSEAANMAGLR